MDRKEEKKADPDKIPNFGRQTKNRLEKLSRILTNNCKPKCKEWMEAMSIEMPSLFYGIVWPCML
jgi:hypothetical protein